MTAVIPMEPVPDQGVLLHPGAVPPYRPQETDLPWAIICDIDGTLAIHGDRGPFEFERCLEDEPNLSVIYALNRFKDENEIFLFSGRFVDFEDKTKYWLGWHGIPYDHLKMRPSGDYSKDFQIKLQMFDEHVRDRFQVRVVLDDRVQVVRLWRALGLPTWQVNDGDF